MLSLQVVKRLWLGRIDPNDAAYAPYCSGQSEDINHKTSGGQSTGPNAKQKCHQQTCLLQQPIAVSTFNILTGEPINCFWNAVKRATVFKASMGRAVPATGIVRLFKQRVELRSCEPKSRETYGAFSRRIERGRLCV
ncbi:hypothetical protein TNCV_4677581 [Trichonephila clavipes]|nr:hypothetical protein TNCV_4677581 [Trichonephila clavipes]